jgi:hypothetical protein
MVEALTTWLSVPVNYRRRRLVSIEQFVHQMEAFYECGGIRVNYARLKPAPRRNRKGHAPPRGRACQW